MWFWLVSLLTVLTTPLALILGRPIRGNTAGWFLLRTGPGAEGGLGGVLVDRYRLRCLTVTIQWRQWGWLRWLLSKMRINAFTWLGHVVTPQRVTPQTLFHECIHVLDQAAHPLLGPVGVLLGYLLDLLTWWSWRHEIPRRWTRVPLAEQVAYHLDGRERFGGS